MADVPQPIERDQAPCATYSHQRRQPHQPNRSSIALRHQRVGCEGVRAACRVCRLAQERLQNRRRLLPNGQNSTPHHSHTMTVSIRLRRPINDIRASRPAASSAVACRPIRSRSRVATAGSRRATKAARNGIPARPLAWIFSRMFEATKPRLRSNPYRARYASAVIPCARWA